MTTRCPVSQKTRCLCLKILTAERSKENSDILMGGNVEAKTPTKVGSDGGRERGSCGHHGLISMGAVVGQSQSSSQDSGNNWCIPSHSSLGCWWENRGESTPVQQVGLCLNLQTSGMFHSFSAPSGQRSGTPRSIQSHSRGSWASIIGSCCHLTKPQRTPHLYPPPHPSMMRRFQPFSPGRQRWNLQGCFWQGTSSSENPHSGLSPLILFFLKGQRLLLENNKMQCVWFTFLISLRNR